MQRFLASVLALLMVAFNFLPVLAAPNSINDVKSNYWAAKEINFVVKNSIMTLDDKGYFNPNATMTRIAFVHSLLKVLSNENLNVRIKKIFR